MQERLGSPKPVNPLGRPSAAGHGGVMRKSPGAPVRVGWRIKRAVAMRVVTSFYVYVNRINRYRIGPKVRVRYGLCRQSLPRQNKPPRTVVAHWVTTHQNNSVKGFTFQSLCPVFVPKPEFLWLFPGLDRVEIFALQRQYQIHLYPVQKPHNPTVKARPAASRRRPYLQR